MGSSIPEIRSRVAPRVAPVWEYLVREVRPAVELAFVPFQRWLAEHELRAIAIELRRRGLTFQSIPHPREFSKFLERSRFSSRGALDPWGTPYTLTLTRDSIIVGSAGPDRERGTEDDLRHAVGRR